MELFVAVADISLDGGEVEGLLRPGIEMISSFAGNDKETVLEK